jgi:uncharacterized membrane protein YfcA
MNAMAGGGAILTYHASLHGRERDYGQRDVDPGEARSAATMGYRQDVIDHKEWLKSLFVPSVLGGSLGAVLLLATPTKTFERFAPFLILFATLLFMLQGALSRWLRPEGRGQTPTRWTAAWLFQFGVGVYGGYFGAGMGS